MVEAEVPKGEFEREIRFLIDERERRPDLRRAIDWFVFRLKDLRAKLVEII